MIDIDPRTRTVTVGTVATVYATLADAMAAYTAAKNATRTPATTSPRKARRLAQVRERQEAGV